jgi:hypothetical protein
MSCTYEETGANAHQKARSEVRKVFLGDIWSNPDARSPSRSCGVLDGARWRESAVELGAAIQRLLDRMLVI